MAYISNFQNRIHIPILIVLISILSFPLTLIASERNSLTFQNKSGEDALVKLVGPSRRVVEVQNQKNRTVHIAGGSYEVYVRYGNGSYYRYVKGEPFQIKKSAYSYTKATLTLHGVINGNYRTDHCSASEFNLY